MESKKSDKGTKKHTTNFWKIGGVGMGNTHDLLRAERKAQDPEVLKSEAATLPDPRETEGVLGRTWRLFGVSFLWTQAGLSS